MHLIESISFSTIMRSSAFFVLVVTWSSLTCASQNFWDDQYEDYESTYPLKRQATLNRKSVRFAYQNPIPVAPTLPPDDFEQGEVLTKPDEDLIDRRQTKAFQSSGHSEHRGSGISNCPPGLVRGRNDCVPDLSWLPNAFGGSEADWSWTDAPVTTARTTLRTTRRPKTMTTIPTTHRHSTFTERWTQTQRTTRKWAWTGQIRTTSEVPRMTTTTVSSNPCESFSPHYRIYPKTKECLLIGSVEVCGLEKNMAFYPKDTVEGECDCLRNTTRPLVYHPKTDTCFFIYQRAYCSDQHWLRINDDGIPACVNNPCWSYGEEMFKWDWRKNSDIPYMNVQGIVPVYEIQMCVPLGHNCYRHENGTLLFPRRNPSIPAERLLAFRAGRVEPECISQSERVDKVQVLDCIPGSKKHVVGDCNIERNG